jgi:drug/metabolite transporter (DMT)-like permease
MTRSHLVAVLQALLVTLLWSSSWVLIKIGLQEIPALTFAGLRYVFAFLMLLPFALRDPGLRRLDRAAWRELALLGLLLYSLTQGAQFLALVTLPAQTASLVLSFTPVAVALLASRVLGERLVAGQRWGVALYLLGVAIYFVPLRSQGGQLWGSLTIVVGMLTNAGSGLLGRRINRSAHLSPLLVTAVSMGVGSLFLLGAGVTVQGLPRLDLRAWAIVLWLAAVNTAFAFTLWNRTLRTLGATESSLINNTMLVQIALLAWLFLGEPLGLRELAAFALVVAGLLIVQLRGAAGARGG